jgi:hypothetical protein
MFVPDRKHTYEPPRPVTAIALLFYMQMMFVPHRTHAYGPPRPVTRIALSIRRFSKVLTVTYNTQNRWVYRLSPLCAIANNYKRRRFGKWFSELGKVP